MTEHDERPMSSCEEYDPNAWPGWGVAILAAVCLLVILVGADALLWALAG